MAQLTEAQVQAIARLARIHFDAGDLERLRRDLARILEYVSALETLDTSEVPPTEHVLEMTGGGRSDTLRPCLDRDSLLSRAPEAAHGHFRVPRVLT